MERIYEETDCQMRSPVRGVLKLALWKRLCVQEPQWVCKEAGKRTDRRVLRTRAAIVLDSHFHTIHLCDSSSTGHDEQSSLKIMCLRKKHSQRAVSHTIFESVTQAPLESISF